MVRVKTAASRRLDLCMLCVYWNAMLAIGNDDLCAWDDELLMCC